MTTDRFDVAISDTMRRFINDNMYGSVAYGLWRQSWLDPIIELDLRYDIIDEMEAEQ